MNIADLVQDSTLTNGTGAITLTNSAPLGKRTFGSAFSAGTSKIRYVIRAQSGGAFEKGLGTLTSARAEVRVSTAPGPARSSTAAAIDGDTA